MVGTALDLVERGFIFQCQDVEVDKLRSTSWLAAGWARLLVRVFEFIIIIMHNYFIIKQFEGVCWELWFDYAGYGWMEDAGRVRAVAIWANDTTGISTSHSLYTRTYLWSKVESKPICCQEVFRRWWTLRFSKAEEQQRTNEHVASDVQLFVSCPLHGVLQIDFKHEILIIRTCASASQSVNRLLASPSPCWTGRLIWK